MDDPLTDLALKKIASVFGNDFILIFYKMVLISSKQVIMHSTKFVHFEC